MSHDWREAQTVVIISDDTGGNLFEQGLKILFLLMVFYFYLLNLPVDFVKALVQFTYGLVGLIGVKRREESSFSIDSRKKLNFLLVVFKYLIRFMTTKVSITRRRTTKVDEPFVAPQKPAA